MWGDKLKSLHQICVARQPGHPGPWSAQGDPAPHNIKSVNISLGKEVAIHSSILAWKISWTEEPGGIQSMGSQRAGHNLTTEHTGSFISSLGNYCLHSKESQFTIILTCICIILKYSSFLNQTS